MLYTFNVNGLVTKAEFTHDQSIKKKLISNYIFFNLKTFAPAVLLSIIIFNFLEIKKLCY